MFPGSSQVLPTWGSLVKQHHILLNIIVHASLVPRPLPDFIAAMDKNWDKIWEWPGDKVKYMWVYMLPFGRSAERIYSTSHENVTNGFVRLANKD